MRYSKPFVYVILVENTEEFTWSEDELGNCITKILVGLMNIMALHHTHGSWIIIWY
jgi:hypothetical protein